MIEINDTYILTPLKKISEDYYEGMVLVCDVPSPLTGRIYNFDGVKQCCDDLQDIIRASELFGALGIVGTDLGFDKISHLITKTNLSSTGELSVELKILKTYTGNILKNLLDAEVKLYISMVSSGFVDNKNTISALRIKRFDLLPSPSTSA